MNKQSLVVIAGANPTLNDKYDIKVSYLSSLSLLQAAVFLLICQQHSHPKTAQQLALSKAALSS